MRLGTFELVSASIEFRYFYPSRLISRFRRYFSYSHIGTQLNRIEILPFEGQMGDWKPTVVLCFSKGETPNS